jgi:hypothetical protein
MLFEVAPEATARRLIEALFAAETGDSCAWQSLEDNDLYRLRTDADSLASLVPYALLRLAEQLCRHPRAPVRLDAIRMLSLVYAADPERVHQSLRRMSVDSSQGVQRAAAHMLSRLDH